MVTCKVQVPMNAPLSVTGVNITFTTTLRSARFSQRGAHFYEKSNHTKEERQPQDSPAQRHGL